MAPALAPTGSSTSSTAIRMKRASRFYAGGRDGGRPGILGSRRDYRLQLDSGRSTTGHRPLVLRRQGVPVLGLPRRAGIPSTFYDLPSNYPPSPSRYGHHRCISGMGTPDMLGTYGTYQHFAEDGPAETRRRSGREAVRLACSRARRPRPALSGPKTPVSKEPRPVCSRFPRSSRPAGQRRGAGSCRTSKSS